MLINQDKKLLKKLNENVLESLAQNGIKLMENCKQEAINKKIPDESKLKYLFNEIPEMNFKTFLKNFKDEEDF